MTDTKIEIRNLYKVFGSNPEAAMKHVHAGLSKQDLLDQAWSCSWPSRY